MASYQAVAHLPPGAGDLVYTGGDAVPGAGSNDAR